MASDCAPLNTLTDPTFVPTGEPPAPLEEAEALVALLVLVLVVDPPAPLLDAEAALDPVPEEGPSPPPHPHATEATAIAAASAA